jgi:hypothetical protein
MNDIPTRRHHMKRAITLVTASILVALAVAVPGIATAGPAEPDTPAAIVVPEGHKPFLVGHAIGVQIHECIAAPTGHRWRFLGPRADLYGDNGNLLATHFTGPSWQAKDGSKITATLDGTGTATVDPTAIPWLRLRVTSQTAGADGDRLLATTFIQRITTTGGLAPAPEACGPETAGLVAEIPYTADYVFWKATGN